MNEFLHSLLIAVTTAVIPILAASAVKWIKKAAERAVADADDIKKQGYIREIADAITDAVAATSQTFVDALKNARKFDKDAQKEAVQKAMAACLASISPAAQKFINAAYGDIQEYLTTRIEAEVWKQKKEALSELLPVGEPFGIIETTSEHKEG